MAKTQTRQVDEAELTDLDVADENEQQLAVVGDDSQVTSESLAQQAEARNDEAMQTFVNWLVEHASGGDDELYDVMSGIMSDILAAENPGEILREQSVLHAKDILNQPLILHDFDIREGGYEDSMFGHYACLRVSRPGSDKTRIVTCGAVKVLMKLYALDRMGEWPQQFMFTSKPGKKGDVLDIVRP